MQGQKEKGSQSREMSVTWRVLLPRSSRGGVWLVSQVRSNPGRWHPGLRPNGKGTLTSPHWVLQVPSPIAAASS